MDARAAQFPDAPQNAPLILGDGRRSRNAVIPHSLRHLLQGCCPLGVKPALILLCSHPKLAAVLPRRPLYIASYQPRQNSFKVSDRCTELRSCHQHSAWCPSALPLVRCTWASHPCGQVPRFVAAQCHNVWWRTCQHQRTQSRSAKGLELAGCCFRPTADLGLCPPNLPLLQQLMSRTLYPLAPGKASAASAYHSENVSIHSCAQHDYCSVLCCHQYSRR